MWCASQRLEIGSAPRRQVQQLLRQHHRALVAVDRFVDDLVAHYMRVIAASHRERLPVDLADMREEAQAELLGQAERGACHSCSSAARRALPWRRSAPGSIDSSDQSSPALEPLLDASRRRRPRCGRRNRSGPSAGSTIERGLCSVAHQQVQHRQPFRARHVARAVGDARVGEFEHPVRGRRPRARRAPAAAVPQMNCRRSMRRPIDRKRQPWSRVMPSSAKPASVMKEAMSRSSSASVSESGIERPRLALRGAAPSG